MIGRRNYHKKNLKSIETQNHYSIRKLSVGVVSAIISFSVLGLSSKTVHAATTGLVSHNSILTSNDATQQTATGTRQEDDTHTWQMGKDEKSYDGQAITQIDAKNFHLRDDQGKELNTESVNNDSFVWTDAKGNSIVDQPKNVGTYYVKLTDSAAKKLQQDNPQNKEQKGIVATYTIKQGQATATLKGYDSSSSVENNKDVPAKKIKQDKRIYVDLNIAGSDKNRYDLQDGDYTFTDQLQSDVTKQIAAGTYHLSLTEQGKNSITSYINSIASYGTNIIDGVERRIPNVSVTFAPSTATLYVYNQPQPRPANLPDGTIWTPAGWTRTNPDHVAQNTTVNLYNSGKANFDQNNKLSKNNAFNYTTFGADITATIAKEDLQIGNKILLATITATNDFTNTVNGQLPLSSASSENGQMITDPHTGKVIGRISVTNHDNGEIDYWFNVTDTDTYGEDVRISNLKDYNAGYLNHHNNFDNLAKLSKDGKPLKTDDTITQMISTASGTYVQKYKVSQIGVLSQFARNFSKMWANANKPVMSGNYYNPALDLSEKCNPKNLIQGIQPQDFTKAFLIEGENIDFSNLSTWERLTIYGVDGQKLLREKSNTVDARLLDKNKKAAFKLSNNLSLQDAIAQTPDGESAYSIQKNGGAIGIVKVKAANIALSQGEITNYVKSSQFYNLQSQDKAKALNETINFYNKIGNQPIEVSMMIGADFKDNACDTGWGTIHDITPNVEKAASLKNDGVKYERGKATITGKFFRTAKIDYYDVDTGKKLVSHPHTVLTGEKLTTISHTINIPLGYKLDHIINSTNISDEDFEKIQKGKLSFDYHFYSDSAKNNPVKVYLKKIQQAQVITYTVIDTDNQNQVLTQNTQLPDVYMVDGEFTGEKNSNQAAADKGYQQVLDMYEKAGYQLAANSTTPDWSKLKDQGYNFGIKLVHHKITVNSDSNWPTWVSDNNRVALAKKITRKITVSGLPGIISPETQVATFNRTATVDQVTGKISTTKWNLISPAWGSYQVADENVPAGFAIKNVTVDGKDYPDVIKNDKQIIGVAEMTPNAGDADIQVNVAYEAVKGTVTFVLVDDDNQKQISTSGPITQQIYSTYNVTAPLNYDFKDKQDSTYYFAKSGENRVIIHLIHHKDTKGITKTVIRTINVEKPDGQTDVSEQSVTLNGIKTTDRVTNDTTESWGSGVWEEISAPIVAGYAASLTSVEKKQVDGNSDDETLNITYKANPQSVNIIYQDSASNKIKSDKVNGVTDQTVSITPKLPAGWILNNHQNIPNTITFKANSNSDILITIKHNIINFTYDHPVAKDQKTATHLAINGGHANDLTKTITRTVTVTKPNHDQTTIKQVANIYRDGVYDDVTGEVTYGDWTSDEQNWTSLATPVVAGYTANIEKIEAQTVTDSMNDTDIQINYTANDLSTKIIYKDEKDHTVKEDIISGKTDQKIAVNYQAPAHWQIAESDMPQNYQFKAANNEPVIVKIAHQLDQKADDTRIITRTIVIVSPDGEKSQIEQQAIFSRSHQYDEVLGKDIYGNWDKSTDTFTQINVPKIKAFTPSKAVIKSVDVNPDTDNSEIEITYTENVVKVNFTGSTNSRYGEKVTLPVLSVKGYSIPELNANDYVWYDKNDNELSQSPVDAGNYTVKLKDEVLTKLNQANDNYHFKFAQNSLTYQIMPANLTLTLTGQDHNKDEKQLDLGRYQLTSAGRTYNLKELSIDLDDLVLVGQNDQVVDSIIPGKYTVKLSQTAEARLQKAMPNYKLSFISSGQFEKFNMQKVQYVDEQGNVIKDGPVFEGSDQSMQDFVPELPLGWMLVADAPSQIKMNGDITKIVIKHAKTKVSASDPKSSNEALPHNPKLNYPQGVDYDDLNKEVTRKIIIILPDQPGQVIVQKAMFARDAEVDEVTGEISYDNWQLIKDGLAEFEVAKIDGYTSNLNLVEAMTPSVDSQYDDVQINYIPIVIKNDQELPDGPEDENEVASDETNQSSESSTSSSDDPSEQKGQETSTDEELFLPALAKATELERHAKDKKRKPTTHRVGLHSEASPVGLNSVKTKAAQTETSNMKNNAVDQITPKLASKPVLPATGSQDSNLSWLGLLLSGLSLSGLWINRKKKTK